MAASRKPRSAEAAARSALGRIDLKGARVAVGYSGGLDSTVLLHVLHRLQPEFGYRLSALHVHHGLSRNAGAWSRSCAVFCRRLGIPFRSQKVAVLKEGKGLEAAARAVRRKVFAALRVDAIALGHHLDDQAETVLFNLLRGAGVAGASGIPAAGRLGRKKLLRPLLEVPRQAILAYARAHRLKWVEDESNADEALTRNFLRRRVGPLLAKKFPRWRESLARAARHFSAARLDERTLLREFLAERGLKAPSEVKLVEMLKQLRTGSGRMAVAHDGAVLRNYRGRVHLDRVSSNGDFMPVQWKGENRLDLPGLGGVLRFRRVRGRGFDLALASERLTVRLRSDGDRLQLDTRRPRRTLKNLFQEAGIPSWKRGRLPLLAYGKDLVWVPGIGVNVPYRVRGRAIGIVPDWRPQAAKNADRVESMFGALKSRRGASLAEMKDAARNGWLRRGRS